MRGQRGFSLIELVIVVMIIGVLGAIAIPRLSQGSEAARINAFVAELNTFAKQIELYQLETGNAVADSSTGQFPIELSSYLHENAWQGATPLGGEWDIERSENGVGLAVGVHYQRAWPDEESLQRADAIMDDGNLGTGMFRKIVAGRYYLILEARSFEQAGAGSLLDTGVSPIVNALPN